MKTSFFTAPLLLATLALTSLPAQAQKAKAKAKPAQPTQTKATPQKSQPTVGIKGAGQVAGGAIRFGEIFALKSGFTYQILSARYALDPFDDYSKAPIGPEEKFLILTVAIKNNNPAGDSQFNSENHPFQVIDANNQTVESARYRLKSKPGEDFAPTLKPGQGVGQNGTDPVEVAISMPIKARAVKLILKQGRMGTSEEVLRFFIADATEAEAGGKPDPKNIIAPLPAVSLPGAVVPNGAFYPTNNFYFRLDGFSSAEKRADRETEEGKHWIFAQVTVRNGLSTKQGLFGFNGGDNIRDMMLVDSDGEKYPADNILKAKRDEEPGSELEGNEERSFRIAFQVPKDATFKSVRLGSPAGHAYVFDAATAGK